jgi:hypothetical protein
MESLALRYIDIYESVAASDWRQRHRASERLWRRGFRRVSRVLSSLRMALWERVPARFNYTEEVR